MKQLQGVLTFPEERAAWALRAEGEDRVDSGQQSAVQVSAAPSLPAHREPSDLGPRPPLAPLLPQGGFHFDGATHRTLAFSRVRGQYDLEVFFVKWDSFGLRG